MNNKDYTMCFVLCNLLCFIIIFIIGLTAIFKYFKNLFVRTVVLFYLCGQFETRAGASANAVPNDETDTFFVLTFFCGGNTNV